MFYQCIKNSFLQDIRYPVNFIFGIMTPIFTLIPIYLIISLFRGIDELSYYIIGIIVWMFLSQIIWGNGIVLKTEKQRGTIEQILVTPTSFSQFLYSKSIYFICKAFFTLILAISISNVFLHTSISFYKLSVIILLAFPFYYGISIITSVFCMNTVYLFAILQTILGFIMIISGLTYEVDFGPVFSHINTFNIVHQMIVLSRMTLEKDIISIISANEAKILILGGIFILVIVKIMIQKIYRNFLKRGI